MQIGTARASGLLAVGRRAKEPMGRPPPAPPAPVPLTMEQAVAYALAHNPTLLAAQQNLLSLKGQEVEAGLRQNPDFSVYGTNLSNPATSAITVRLQPSALAAL